MNAVKLIVLYPYPPDVEKFNQDYVAHLKLLDARMQLPEGAKPYTVTRFVETPQGKPQYYQMFSMAFPSVEALMQANASPAMQEVGADAVRLSTGGMPVMMVGME